MKDIHRCPFCNINDIPKIEEEEHPQQYAEGFRHYCSNCELYVFEPVIDVSDIKKAIRKNGTHFGSDELSEPICQRIWDELGLGDE